ncbi:pseudouridine synthase [Ureaplasma zalophigenitalium]|uniref:Pseudouridine synthase n=1 Tax=Ureaplasma zalophigenitalium TaxID=907723 RepID=A0ABT3BPA5_9BACT|nr:pseudouridine synthase [Ureaplasma zalophigenitalium]MCV3754057.1 pseudouridine synthase [Ureaplasma zalophigenitalium]
MLRLDKFLTDSLDYSRKTVRQLIRQGRICVNNKIIRSNEYIDPTCDIITLDNQVVSYQKFRYFLLNKPQGYITANHDSYNKVIFDLLPDLDRNKYFAVGRLDKDTEGLLIITNDGLFAHKMLHPRSRIAKTYYLEVHADFNDYIKNYSGPIRISGYVVHDYQFNFLSARSAELTIYEGKFHQVKKMLKFFDYQVTFLKRIAFGKLYLPDDLKKGEIKTFDPSLI